MLGQSGAWRDTSTRKDLGNLGRSLIGAVAFVAAISLTAGSARGAEAAPAASLEFLGALDLDGTHHTIGEPGDARVTALVFITNECPISRRYIPELNRLAEQTGPEAVRFCGVISDPSLTRADAAEFAEEFKIGFPVLFDASGELAAAVEPTHVPEAFVLDADHRLVYRGRIDDRYAEIDKKRPTASTHDLLDAIVAARDGRPVETSRTDPVGCLFEADRAAPADAEITYSRDIAPILQGNCAECHRPGEVAPFSLLTYEDAAKRADWIRDVTSTRLMPPWKAEIGHGDFLGARRLTDRQIELLAAWAESGAPKGNDADLPPAPQFASGWRLGEPGMVVEAPSPLTVPADGPDLFHHWVIPLELEEDMTVTGFEFRPGNRAVVHHAILFLDNSGLARRKDAETPEPGYTTFGSIGIPISGVLGVWTPGMTPRFFGENLGMPIEKGADLVLQLHIHPSGKEETDLSSVALYFSDTSLDKRLAPAPFVAGSLLVDIAADESSHRVTSSMTLPTDVTLLSLLPHMHLIGKEMKLTATLPDGEQVPMIWIKDWNFYWQDNYVYREPLRLPKGTRIDVESVYDNSEENPLNPNNPPQRVLFGNDSTDEMCFAIFQVVADSRRDERRLQSSMVRSFIEQWNDTSIDPEAKEVIIRETKKLLGMDEDVDIEAILGPPRQSGS